MAPDHLRIDKWSRFTWANLYSSQIFKNPEYLENLSLWVASVLMNDISLLFAVKNNIYHGVNLQWVRANLLAAGIRFMKGVALDKDVTIKRYNYLFKCS